MSTADANEDRWEIQQLLCRWCELVDGDDRMTFGGRAPDWDTNYR